MRFLHFILSHSVFIALCALGLCYQTGMLLHIPIHAYLYAFVFFATLCSYNFYWMLGSYQLARSDMRLFLKKHYTNIIFFSIAGLGALITAWQQPAIWPLMIAATLLTLLYAVPLMPFPALHFTRKAGFLKPVLLSLTWAFVTVYIPCRAAAVPDSILTWLLFSNRFLFMLMLCIIFDKRDEQLDKIRGLHTLATDVPTKQLRIIMAVIFIAYLANGVVLRLYFHDLAQIAALLIIGIVTAVVYLYSQKRRGYFFYYFLVDGLMLFSAIATYIAGI